MAKIFVDINGDASEFLDEAKKAEAASERLADEFVNMGKQADKAGADLNDLGKSTSKFGNATKSLVKSIADTNAALKQLNPGANTAGQSLTNLGRIAQDAPFGFIGIQNNINPLLESFQRLKAETGSTGGALKALGSQLGGAAGLGLAVSVVTGLLVVFGDALFGSKSAAEKAEEGINGYRKEVDALKESVDAISRSISFANQLGAIDIKIAGFGNETGNELTDLRQQSIAQGDAIANAQKFNDELFRIYQERSATVELGSKEQLELSDQYYKDSQQGNKALEAELNKQTLIYRQIALQKLADQKEVDDKAKAARDKALADNKKYVTDTIAEAKKLADYLNKATNRQFDPGISDDPRQALQEQFDNAIKFLQKAALDQRSFALKLNAFPEITLDTGNAVFLKNMAAEAAKVAKALTAEINKLPKQKILIDFEAFKKNGDNVVLKLNEAIFGKEKYEGLDVIYRDALKAADSITGVLNPAFNDLFDAIAAGENPLKAFFQSIGQSIKDLIKKLIQAAIQALILTAILPGGGAAQGGFAGLFKGLLGGARANGGSVLSGRSYLVGERGPEIFTAPGSGRIVPNGDLNSGLQGITGGGGQTIVVTGKIRGKDLLLSGTREGAYQSRNV